MSEQATPSNAEVIAELRMLTIALALCDFDLNALAELKRPAPEPEAATPSTRKAA